MDTTARPALAFARTIPLADARPRVTCSNMLQGNGIRDATPIRIVFILT